jgi:hypothetical protein
MPYSTFGRISPDLDLMYQVTRNGRVNRRLSRSFGALLALPFQN